MAVVEYGSAGATRRTESGSGTSLRQGDRVVVVAGAVPPRKLPSRLTPIANGLVVIGLLAGGLLASAGWPVERALVAVFGLASLGLWLHVADGVRRHLDRQWTLGMGVLAVNFSAWTAALMALADR